MNVSLANMKRLLSPATILGACLLWLPGCEEQLTLVTLDVTPGHEASAFSSEPPVVKVQIEAVSASGETLASAEATPGSKFALGDFPLDQLLHFEVHGFDETATLQLRGRSLSLMPGALQSGVLPIFAQRLGSWSRPPGQLPSGKLNAVAAVANERHLLLAGGQPLGDTTETNLLYDMLALAGSSSSPLPRSPKSMVPAPSGQAVLLVNNDGATWVDFTDGSSSDAPLPVGLSSFDEVAGGRVVVSDEGSYLVGATRDAFPSDKILVITTNGELNSAQLAAPRAGAAVTWVPERGLAIAGGSATAAGLEMLPPGGSSGVPLPYPSDDHHGAAAVSIDGSTLWLAGGISNSGQTASFRHLDLSCTIDCTTQTAEIAFDTPLVNSYAFIIDSSRVLLLGTDNSNGLLRSYMISVSSPATALELPLREPRAGAVPIATPNGTLVLLGGQLANGQAAHTVESFFPE